MPEASMSTVAVAKDKVITTVHVPIQSEDQKNSVTDILRLCLDASSGEVLWQIELPGTSFIPLAGGFSDGTVFSPITGGEHVWFFNRCGSIGCYDMDGTEIWARLYAHTMREVLCIAAQDSSTGKAN